MKLLPTSNVKLKTSIHLRAVAANEKKAAAKSEKDKAAAKSKEDQEAKEWNDGAKGSNKKELAEQKRLEELNKKKEREALLAAEEKELSKKPTKPIKELRGPDKVAARKTQQVERAGSSDAIEEFSASNVDDALDLLTISGAGSSSSGGRANEAVERHPERRVKAAYAAYEERELPILKAENPGLRLSQLKEILYKNWKKSPENPMNQDTVSYDTTKADEREAIAAKKAETMARLQV
ncbi:hypothetical protein SmJEL517_g02020 [Synchytrium microbalum]|uniref:HMG box domain-containing protein n=1 Tax=Synchytrium microbalum TaxID=1806994 RepID=A0A507C2I2_9FUNG|nr:uncharacterized protein SmJEL517_g02020 [Synchytrium microbalum]TPX35720.1 hypothetical protein SmJEL517_g02020 [Synchytrium microbalum]